MNERVQKGSDASCTGSPVTVRFLDRYNCVLISVGTSESSVIRWGRFGFRSVGK